MVLRDDHPPGPAGVRRNWLDWSRVFCLFLVVFGHAQQDASPLNACLSTFRMPLFFLLSGYNRKPELSPTAHFRRDLRVLLLPYLCFWAILYPYWGLVVAPRHPDLYVLDGLEGFLWKPLRGLLLGLGHDTPWSYSVSAPLWFLAALFALRTSFNAAFALSGSSLPRLAPLALVLPALAFLAHSRGMLLPLSLDSALAAFPFFLLGALVREGRFARIARPLKAHPFLAALLCLLALAPMARSTGRVDLANMVLGANPLLFYPTALLGSVGLVALSLGLDRLSHPLLRFVATGSLSIMALHQPFIAMGRLLLVELDPLGSLPAGLPTTLVLALFALASSLPSILLLERLAPWATGRRRGALRSAFRALSPCRPPSDSSAPDRGTRGTAIHGRP